MLLCRDSVHEFTVLVSNSHADIYFSSNDEGDGFFVSYEGVPNDVTGKLNGRIGGKTTGPG